MPRFFASRTLLILTSLLISAPPASAEPPNILFIIADDHSWAHAGAYGDPAVRTPNFDRVAKNGVLFTHAFCASPSCSPSRAAILTGQDVGRLGEGANLHSTIPAEYPVFPELLAQAGYAIGHTGKGWGPGKIYEGGRTTDPLGPWYMDGEEQNKREMEPKLFKKPQNVADNLTAFLETSEGKPFFFWFGSNDPHRPYETGSGLKSEIDVDAIVVPPFLPDVPAVREDLADYLHEIENLDRDIGALVGLLEERGLLENTLIVITSDNGLPFPRAKTTLYDYGTRMPLAIQWAKEIKGDRVVDDFVNLIDLAPTFLEAANVAIPKEMTGRSLLGLLLSGKSGRVEAARDRVMFGRERHSVSRIEEGHPVGYPMRAVRTDDFLYIRNFEPDRIFASGDEQLRIDVDPGLTHDFLIEHKNDPEYAPLWELCFGKRPAEELYQVKDDPFQLVNLANDPKYAAEKEALRAELQQWMERIQDPRASGNGIALDAYVPRLNRPSP